MITCSIRQLNYKANQAKQIIKQIKQENRQVQQTSTKNELPTLAIVQCA